MFAGTRWGGLASLAGTSLSAAAGVQQGGTTTTTTLCPASICVACWVGGEGGWVGDVGVDNETIAVGDEVNKTLQSTTRETEGRGGKVQQWQKR